MEDRTSVYAMVHKVLADSKEKIAESQAMTKQAAAKTVSESQASASSQSGQGINDFLKIADACDHLAKKIHLVNDERTPQEKLAEYTAVHEALKKMAVEAGDNDPNKAHQTQKANPESDPPETVVLDDSGTGVGLGNAVPSEETDTPGTSLDAGESGAATEGHQSPKSVIPTEKPNPQDAANALETNQEMMLADQPEDVLKQAQVIAKLAKDGKIRPETAVAMLKKRASKTAGVPPALAANAAKIKAVQDPLRPGAETPPPGVLKKKAMILLHKAAQEGIPPETAMAMLKAAGLEKAAEDAINPAGIAAGTKPLLQSAVDANSAQMQGSEVGENTPRETAPTSGEGAGRELLSNVEAVINATKGQAKKQNKGALAELLTEPAMSAAHDKTLQQSLDNTSSAGVKISAAQVGAARELLRRFQGSSSENAQKLAALVKLSQDPELAAGGGAPPGEVEPAPEDEMSPEVLEALQGTGEGEAPVVSDEALEAVKSGVTPEELVQAEELLSAQGTLAALGENQVAQEGAGIPEAAGPLEGERTAQMGGDSSSMGGLPMTPAMT